MSSYIVKSGDTLDSIAKMFGVNTNSIILANNLASPYQLFEGQVLNIPMNNANIFDYYVVKKNDTLYNIAMAFGTTVDTLAAVNGIDPGDYIYEGQTLLVPKKGVKTYITKQGDSVSSVANYFNVLEQQLLMNNPNVYLLPDQLLVIRSGR